MDGAWIFLLVIVVVAVAVVAAPVWFTAYLIKLCRERGVTFVKVEDRALSPSSLQAFILLFATVVGGLWVLFTVYVSGSLELSKLQVDKIKRDSGPNLKIDLQAESFSSVSMDGQKLVPLHVMVTVENPGYLPTPLKFDLLPLLSMVKVDGKDPYGDVKGSTLHLPYRKLDCGTDRKCNVTEWKSGLLESGGVGYYSFLHPGLTPGLYYVQFQLPVPADMIKGSFNPKKPVVWTRAKYVQVSTSKVPMTEQRTPGGTSK
jgi:hypothetical protein